MCFYLKYFMFLRAYNKETTTLTVKISDVSFPENICPGTGTNFYNCSSGINTRLETVLRV